MISDTRSALRDPWRALALLPLVTLLTSGCLGAHYAVPRAELERLVRTAPEERGRSVYAVQRFSTAREPEPAPAWEPDPGPPPLGYGTTLHGDWVPSFYVDTFGPPYYAPVRRPPPELSGPGGSGLHGASPVPAGSPRPSSHGTSSGSIGDIRGVDKLLVLAVVVGVGVGLTLAVTEGARYEGAVAVHPHHPLHLLGTGSEERVVALDELTPADLDGLDEATLSGEEGAGLWLRGAAPLNRQGFTYQLGAGLDSLALPGGRAHRDTGYRFALGYFPTRAFGLLADTRLQFASGLDSAYYNVRLGLEAQAYPLSLWRLHLGPFVGGGRAWSASAGGSLPTARISRPYLAFGGVAEFELTTRLALAFRWTQDWMPSAIPEARGFVHSWSLGLSIY